MITNLRALLPVAAILAGALVLLGCPGKDKNEEAIPAAEAHKIFESTCARCHGLQGTGGPPVSPGGPSPRNFHDAEFQKTRSDEDIRRTITEGKPPGMPSFGTTFTQPQIRGLVGVVRTFNPAH